MNNLKLQNIFLSLLLLLFGLGSFAQVFPVQMTPVFNTPYSSKISDYATSLDTKFQLIVNPTDIGISNRQVRFKIYIQGNGINAQSSDFVTGLNPIYINGGDLITLTNVDLAALFRLENLQGLTAVEYANPLPEGIYSFCFELYDFVTNQRISQKSCANLYLILNDPPLLNLPARNEQIPVTDFPNILFTWTPRQLNATNVSYKFELKEIQDPNINPQFGFALSPLLYEETLFATALNYDLGKPNLIAGKRYAWRVRAISTSGLSENAVFKNEGYSEIFWFTYASLCLAPSFVLSDVLSAKSVKLTWQGNVDNTKYHVQYRKKDTSRGGTNEWFSIYTLNQQTTISDLEAGVDYEFRVGATCEPAGVATSYTYSGINFFVMPAEGTTNTTFSCGINPAVAIANRTPLTNLIVSETFTAGDFPVKILELQGNNPYSGRGYIVVPYLADTKIAVQFNNVTINTAYQLINGVVETTYNPDWVNVGDVEDVVGENTTGQVTQIVPFVVTNITINPAGDIVVSGTSGQQVTIPGGNDTVITDSAGNVYSVDSQGNVTGPYAPAAGGAPTPANTDGVSTSGQVTQFTAQGVKAKFKALAEAKYAFDVMPASAPQSIKNQYKKIGTIPLPYKAVVNGEEDRLLAEIEISDSKIKLKDIVFKTQNGVLIKADTTGGKSKVLLTVKGSLTYAEEEVLATIKQGDKYKVAGAFKLVHISAKEMNVVLIPLNNQSIPATAKADIESIYKTVGIKVNVATGDNIAQTGSKITVGNSDFLATYTDDEKAINNKIKALSNYKGNTYYLIYSKLPPSIPSIQGFMPLTGQFGYVFPNASLKTASHELGHGALGLEHPIKNQTNDQQTGWLMDYGTGKTLSHLDWKQINDPKFRLYNFQGDSEGQFAGGYVLTPDLKITSIPGTNSIFTDFDLSNIPVGTLPGFVITKENLSKSYKWVDNKYQNVNDPNDIYPHQIYTNPVKEVKMMLFYNLTNKCNGRFIRIEHNNHITPFKPNATELLNLIDANKLTSKLIACSTNIASSSDWVEFNQAIDCSASNILATIGSKLNAIKNGLNTSISATAANTLLKNNYNSCVFENLDITTRIKILNLFLKDNVDDALWEFSDGSLSLNDRFFIGKIITSTPPNDRFNLLKNGFMLNPQWLRILWTKSEPAIFNNDVDLEGVTTLVSIVSNWVLENYTQLNIPENNIQVTLDAITGVQPMAMPRGLQPILLDESEGDFEFNLYDGYNTKIGLYNKIIFQENGKIKFIQTRVGTERQASLNSLGNAVYNTVSNEYNEIFHPFEAVTLKIGNNFEFLNFGNNDVSNKEIVIPSILAALYLQKVINNQTQHNVRQVGNAVAITAAIAAVPFTGGGSLAAWSANLAVAGGITATIDIPTQQLKQQLIAQNQFQQYKEPFEAWETLYNTVALAEGAAGVSQLGIFLKNYNYSNKWNIFSAKIKSIPEGSPISYLKGKWNAIRGINVTGNWVTTLKTNTSFSTYLEGLTNGSITRKFATILNIEEEAVLKFYTTNLGYKDFNRALRGEIPMTDFYTAQKNLMEQTLAKMPTSSYNNSQNLLYRIENLTEAQIASIYVEGGTINTKAFTSVTYSEDAIIDAIRNRPHNVLIRIEGKNGKLIEDLSTLPAEKELLFKTGTNFKVDKVGFSPNPDGYMTPIKTIWLKEL